MVKSGLVRILRIILDKVRLRAIVGRVLSRMEVYYKRRKAKFRYSREWYEKRYHSYGAEESFEEKMRFNEEAGYKKELFESFDNIDSNYEKQNWLEVACHFGKTAFWLAEKFKSVTFYMFDFSEVAVNYCKRNNPIPCRSVIWQCDSTSIAYEGSNFNDYFDLITCLDVTEHLPDKVYVKTIFELYRVLKPSGLLIVKQGVGGSPSHIHVLPESKLINDFCRAGFMLVKELPHRHHLFQKLG